MEDKAENGHKESLPTKAIRKSSPLDWLPLYAAVIAAIVTAGQVWVSKIQADAELKLKAAEFLASNTSHILSKDLQERDHIIAVIKVTFPEHIAETVIKRANDINPDSDPKSHSPTQGDNGQASDSQPENNNSSYFISYTSIKGVPPQSHENVISYLKDNGFTINRADQRDDKPSWFATAPTVLYYAPQAREKANMISEGLKKATGVTFNVSIGAGRGVPSDKKGRYFIIHYPR